MPYPEDLVLPGSLLDQLLGLEAPELDQTVEPEFQLGRGGRFIEGLSGLENAPSRAPRNFGEGLLTGASRGLGSAGTRIRQERAKVEAASLERQKQRDQANLQASRDYRRERGQALSKLSAEQREDKRRKTEYERDNPQVTQEHLKAMPWLARTFKVGDRAPISLLAAKPEKAAAPERDRLVQVMGPNGVPVWVPESQAVGKPAAQAARAVTGQERQNLAYYNRGKDAINTIEVADRTGQTLEQRMVGLGSQIGLQYAPNFMKSPDQQAYRQAQRAFTEARLRKESGAAIPTQEYENDARTYFVQPGDTPATIEQKRRARQVVLEGLKFSSGKAYDEFYGEMGGYGADRRANVPRDPRGRPPLESFVRP